MCSLMMISDKLSKHVGAVKSVLKKWFKINDIQLVHLLVVWYLVNYLIRFCNTDSLCLQQWYELSVNMMLVQFHLQVFNQNSFSRFGNTTCGRADRHSCFFYLDFIWGERKSRQSQFNAANFFYLYCCTVHFEDSLNITHQQMHQSYITY